MARFKLETVAPDALKQLVNIPRLLTSLNGCVIGCKTAIVRHTGPVLEQLTKRVRSTVERFVESETLLRNEQQSGRCNRSFGEAPPRNTRLLGGLCQPLGCVYSRDDQGRFHALSLASEHCDIEVDIDFGKAAPVLGIPVEPI